MAPLPDGYRYERLKRADIPALIDGIKRWHPDIAVGGGSCYLQENFYTAKVFLDDESQKDIFVGVFKRGDELAGMWSWEQEPDALTLYGRLIVVAPEHRDAKLASKVMPMAELAVPFFLPCFLLYFLPPWLACFLSSVRLSSFLPCRISPFFLPYPLPPNSIPSFISFFPVIFSFIICRYPPF